MPPLARVFACKIVITVLAGCAPLILLPAAWLEAAGFPPQADYLWLRLLGWAWLSLCVGYGFGLRAALRGEPAPGPVWTGIVSNAGVCLLLAEATASGSLDHWSPQLQTLAVLAALATAVIVVALWWFGARRGLRRDAGRNPSLAGWKQPRDDHRG